MKHSENLTTRETLCDYNYTSNGLSITVLNSRDLYCRLEALCISVSKRAKRAGGLDMSIIENSSILKDITRSARKMCREKWDEVWTMDDDREARKHLAYYIAEFAFNC